MAYRPSLLHQFFRKHGVALLILLLFVLLAIISWYWFDRRIQKLHEEAPMSGYNQTAVLSYFTT